MGTKHIVVGAIGAALLLAGCTSTGQTGSDGDLCGAAELQNKIGQPLIGATPETIRIGGEPLMTRNEVRVVSPERPISSDVRPDRLTLDVDERGTLVSASCY